VSTPLRPANRSLTAIDGAIALIAVLLIVQMWLLTATVEAFLAGHHEVALPAAIVSALLFGACFALHLFIDRADRASRQPPRR
jgi:predicted Co/Zn/Cd cation transporter (cation efflux family)